MFASVEKLTYPDPMRIGIGLEDDAPALYAAEVKSIIAPVEVKTFIKMWGFRSIDTLVFVQPALLRNVTYRALIEISEGDGHFEVIGHEPTRLKTKEDIERFRGTRAVVGPLTPVREIRGRPNKITYTVEQAEAILRLWYALPRRAPDDVNREIERILKLEEGQIKPQWVKDLAIKFIGSAKRTPPDGWEGIMFDADGKNVRYWEGDE